MNFKSELFSYENYKKSSFSLFILILLEEVKGYYCKNSACNDKELGYKIRNMGYIQEKDKKQSMLHRILLQASTLSDIGLFHGKAGIVIFFMHYFQQTGNALYEDVAGELLDEITEELRTNLPVNLEFGLSGIGWAIDYLIENKFVEGDSLDICEEIDNKIMEVDPRRLTDYSLEKGIGGILLYALAHTKTVFNQCGKIPFDSCYLHDLYLACVNIRFSGDLPSIITHLIDTYLLFYTDSIMPDEGVYDLSFITKNSFECDVRIMMSHSLGFQDGLAGMLYEECCMSKNKYNERNMYHQL